MNSFITGTDSLITSGVSSRCALYASYAWCLNVGPLGSKAIPMCVGFSFLRTSSRVFMKPKMADVLNPFELILGFFINA